MLLYVLRKMNNVYAPLKLRFNVHVKSKIIAIVLSRLSTLYPCPAHCDTSILVCDATYQDYTIPTFSLDFIERL